MRYAIQVNGPPGMSPAASHARQFIKAAIAKGHEVTLVFFYFDGVVNGLAPSADAGWSELATRYNLDLVLCVSAAERRGWNRADPAGPQLLPGFRIGGLGQWVDVCARADRYLVFAA